MQSPRAGCAGVQTTLLAWEAAGGSRIPRWVETSAVCVPHRIQAALSGLAPGAFSYDLVDGCCRPERRVGRCVPAAGAGVHAVAPQAMKRSALRRCAPLRRSGPGALKGRPLLRDWTDALEKVSDEGVCRICGQPGRQLQAAHILGRKYDRPKHAGGKRLWVNPLHIFPACLPCHYAYDNQEVFVERVLSSEEIQEAIRIAGHGPAMRRIGGRTWLGDVSQPAAPFTTTRREAL